MTVAGQKAFHYPLEPLREMREWKCDAALSKLAGIQGRLTQERQALGRLEEAFRREASTAATAWTQSPNPSSRNMTMHYLQLLKNDIAARLDAIRVLETSLDEARGALARAELGLEVIEEHRKDSMADFTQEAARSASAQADRDWLVRRVSGIAGREGGAP